MPLGIRQALAPAPHWAIKTLHFFTELLLLEVQQTAILLDRIHGQPVPLEVPTSFGSGPFRSYLLSTPAPDRTPRSLLFRLSQQTWPLTLALQIAFGRQFPAPKQLPQAKSPLDLLSTPQVPRKPVPLTIKSLTIYMLLIFPST